MIYDALTSWIDGADYPTTIATGAIMEGLALITVIESNVPKVAIGSASNNDHFAGVAINRRATLTTYPQVDVLTLSAVASGVCTATLSFTPNNPSTAMLLSTAAGVIATWETSAGAVTGTGEYNVTGLVLTCYSDVASTVITVVYKYNLTSQQATQLGGDHTSLSATQQFNNCGVMKRGVVYTDCFDPSVNWAAWNASVTVKVNASGYVTSGGTGATVTNFAVENVPSSDIPFLGYRFATV